MNFNPQLFIGVLDFFSVLLPGALLTYLLMRDVGPVVLEERYAKLSGSEAWTAFLTACYLVGHLVFLVGSSLDGFYDWARRHTLNAQIALLARRGRLLPWPARALIWLAFKGERNLAVDRATRIKHEVLSRLQAKSAINTFQWCKARLNADSQASLAVVQRFEADSKFFRCFTVVLLLLLAVWPWQRHWPLAGVPVVLGLLLLALWRYMEQRFKATNQAYWSVITLTAQEGKIALVEAKPAAGSATHAGGVVFRERRGRAEYLLVEASNDPAQWVLPKGHVEEGERHSDAAVREVHEETGVWARIVRDLGDVSYQVDGNVVTARFFLMRSIGRGLRQDKERGRAWLPVQQAVAQASHIETRELLQRAEQRRSRTVSASPALTTHTSSS